MHLDLTPEDLRPLIAEVIAQAMTAQEAQLTPGRIGYTEPEAAAVIGVERHILRDARLRGEIHARLVGKRFVYSADALRKFLEGGR